MFAKLGLSPVVAGPLARLGYETPTPIQTRAIPLVLSGVDVLARAHTGTGKTAAFGLPMIDRFFARPLAAGRVKPRGLVVVPTRELAAQVDRALAAYGASARIGVTAIFGGVSMGRQIQALRRGTDILVATPGRLIDHLQRRTVDLSGIEVLTLDEADRMLDMGFLPAIRRVIAALPRDRQTLLFSATLSEAVVRLSAEFTRNVARLDVSCGQIVTGTVRHQMHHVPVDRKRDVLAQLLREQGEAQTLVFCRTKRGANRVGEDLEQRGIRAGVIHGNKSQNARLRALDDFKAGRLRVLVATDVAARGLDIVQLPLVVNFDLPLVADDYVHRVGRTGRAGHPGRAVSLVTATDATVLRDIQRLVSTPIESVGTPTSEPAKSSPTGQRRPPTHRSSVGFGPASFGRHRTARHHGGGRRRFRGPGWDTTGRVSPVSRPEQVVQAHAPVSGSTQPLSQGRRAASASGPNVAVVLQRG